MERTFRKIKISVSAAGLFLFIIATAEAAVFDFGRYKAVLKGSIKTGASIDGIMVSAVDYAALAADAENPDSDYSLLLEGLAVFDPETFDRADEQKAFWINVYNIAAIKTIVDHYPVDSIRSRSINWLGIPWNRKVIRVGGREYSLGQIEHDILLDTYGDLKIHFAINCASVSCVDLAPAPYYGTGLSDRLDAQGRAFLSNRRKGLSIDRKNNVVYLSRVFKFDKKRFDDLAGGALKFILPFISAEDREFLGNEKFSIKYLEYNWKSNDMKHIQ